MARSGPSTTSTAASQISNTAAGNIASTTVQDAIDELDSEKAGLGLANTFTQKQTLEDFLKLQRALEKITVTADNPASGDNNFDLLTQSVQLYTTANDTNFVINIRGDGSNSLDSLMTAAEVTVVTVMVTNTGTPYYMTGLKIDGSAATVKWLNGLAPAAGNANSIDVYTFAITKTASATYTILGNMTKYA